MSDSDTVLFLVIEVAIVAFSAYRAHNKGPSHPAIDINRLTGGAATFNFWLFFLNCLVGAIALQNIFLGVIAAALWLVRQKLKKDESSSPCLRADDFNEKQSGSELPINQNPTIQVDQHQSFGNLPKSIVERSDRAIHRRTSTVSPKPIVPSESPFAGAGAQRTSMASTHNVLAGQSELEQDAVLIEPDAWVLTDSDRELFNSETGERLRSDSGLGFSIGKDHYILHNKSVSRKISIEDLLLENITKPSKNK